MKQRTKFTLRKPGFLLFFTLLILLTSSCQFLNFGNSETGCGPSTLEIGKEVFKIKTIKLKSNGQFRIPANESSTAYWLEGGDQQDVFVISPPSDKRSLLANLGEGTPAKVSWANCNSTGYALSAPQPGSFDARQLPDPSATGIVIYVQADAPQDEFFIGGELTGEEIRTFDTPSSGGAEPQAEVSLLETTPSADQATLQFEISIYNYGTAPLTISTGDVSLTQQDGTILSMVSSEPPLPKEIAASATEEFTFTFPRPSTPGAALKILTVEYEVEGY